MTQLQWVKTSKRVREARSQWHDEGTPLLWTIERRWFWYTVRFESYARRFLRLADAMAWAEREETTL